MTDAIPEGWTDFFVATAGAAAALAGLIIVAMTVNIRTILGIPGMTSRAAATIASLVLIVVSAAAGLIPGQGAVLLGAEVAVFTVATLGLTVDAGRKMIHAAERPFVGVTWVKTGIGIIQIVPFAVGAVILLTGGFAGLYWLAAGVLLVFIGSVANAWVLLVEILR